MNVYQCDVMIVGVYGNPKYRCKRAAAWVGDNGEENLYFCDAHMPSDWSGFRHVYVIKNNDLVETGVTKQAEGCPVIAQKSSESALRTSARARPMELAQDALERYTDGIRLHGLGVRYEKGDR